MTDGVKIELYTGPRSELRTLFELAEDSPTELDAYLHAGRALVARSGPNVRSVERDAFGPATGYPAGLEIDGIALRDRVWLDRTVGPAQAERARFRP
jgi:hypothetical protein